MCAGATAYAPAAGAVGGTTRRSAAGHGYKRMPMSAHRGGLCIGPRLRADRDALRSQKKKNLGRPVNSSVRDPMG